MAALLMATLTACGSGDSGSSIGNTAVTKTADPNMAKDTQSIKARVHLPQFSEVKFTMPVTIANKKHRY